MPPVSHNPQTLTYSGAVYPWHCDHVGHMNVMWYVGKFDEATWVFFSRAGLTPDYLRKAGRGMAAVEQHLFYERELLAGDVISVTTKPLEVREKLIRFEHVMSNAQTGETAARCTLTALHLDRQARKACPFSEDIFHTLRELSA